MPTYGGSDVPKISRTITKSSLNESSRLCSDQQVECEFVFHACLSKINHFTCTATLQLKDSEESCKL